MLPDYDRAGVIGEYWANPKTRTFAELLIDAEERPEVRAVLVGMLREAWNTSVSGVVSTCSRLQRCPSMSEGRVPSGSPSPSSAEQIPGARESKLSRYCLWWLPAAPVVGFALAGRVLKLGEAGPWELWKVAVLAALMGSPFAVGVYFGLRSVRKGFRGGWVGLVANLVLGALAVGMPIAEALSD